TSGLTDDSREADERAADRTLRDLRGRVKAARAAVSTTPGTWEIFGVAEQGPLTCMPILRLQNRWYRMWSELSPRKPTSTRQSRPASPSMSRTSVKLPSPLRIP